MSLKLHTASATSFYKEPNSLRYLQNTANSSQKNFSYSRYENKHEKPTFFPPTPKILTLEDTTGIESFHFDLLDDSQEVSSYRNIVDEKSPKSEILVKLLIANPASPNLQAQKQAYLTIEEPSVEYDTKISPKNGVSTPTIIKEIDHERSSSQGSEIIQLTDANQVDIAVFEHMKPGTANLFGTTLVPSRFALDVMSKNALRGHSNEVRSGDIKSRVLSADEANQTIVSPGIVSPAASHTSHVPKDNKKWRNLSHVLHSISAIQKPEAASITEKDVAYHIENFHPRVQKEKFDAFDRICRRDGTREAFHTIRTIKTLCDYAAVGSPKHIKLMKEILDEDPRKNMYEPQDSNHLLNKHNTDGVTPLCVAAQNGNYEVVKFLIEKGADHLRETKITQKRKTKDVALELTVRWGHRKVVEYLLEKCVHPYQILQNCLYSTDNKSIIEILVKHMKSKNMKPKKNASCFGK